MMYPDDDVPHPAVGWCVALGGLRFVGVFVGYAVRLIIGA